MGLLDVLRDAQFRKDTGYGLLDAANRGVIGGLLGGPVDMANGVVNAALMAGGVAGHKLGLLKADQLPEPVQVPFGGSEWIGQKMQNLGMVSDKRNPIAEALAGVALPMATARVAPQLFAAEQAMARNMAAPSPMNQASRNQAGAIVWHGTPHKFDKFDSSKIGTGEGAQAYGHGLYLADSPNVANGYKAQLATSVEFGGKPFYDGRSGRKVGSTGLGELDDYLLSTLGDTASARKRLLADVKDVRSTNPEGVKEYQQMLADLRKVRSDIKATNDGSLYKVDLPDAAIAKMLDWDKPLTEQAPNVRKALQDSELMKYADVYFKANKNAAPTVADLHDFLKYSGYNQQQISSKLADQGIPGIRYLDGGSRSAGQGTSNYVVFPGEENLLTILERNGLPIGQ